MRRRVFLYSGLVVFLILGAESPAQARSASLRSHCHPISVDLGLTAANPGGTDLASFPVYVHYMKHAVSKRDPSTPKKNDSTPRLTLEMLQDFFSPTGKFNKVWSAHGIRFVLVGVERCTYRLKSFDSSFTENETMPSNAPDLRDRVFSALNVSSYKVGRAKRPFKGLDLYIWLEVEDAAGLGSSPKFSVGAGGGSTVAQPGGAWIDLNCLSEPAADECTRAFSHEAGHFFGLCHACSSRHDTSEKQFQTCTTPYCSDVVTFPGGMPDCDDKPSYATRLMRDNYLGATLRSEEIDRATATASTILNQD
jgi:hypothetical protein